MNSESLRVNEIFGPTVQGEGPSLGHPALFLRLAYCNLRCGFCDTTYSWDWSRYDRREEVDEEDIETVGQRLMALGRPELLVISGGEPMLQQDAIVKLLIRLERVGWEPKVEIETNGTIAPDRRLVARVTTFNVSPKLSNAGMGSTRRLRPDVLHLYQNTGKSIWKFVLDSETDVIEIDQLVERHQLKPVYVMPQGQSVEEVNSRYAVVAKICIERGWYLTARLHLHIWGSRRAV